MNPIKLGQFPGRTLEEKGRSWLYFGGTAYLGLQEDEAFQEIFIRNIRRYGTSYGASRVSNVRFPHYEEAETLLALRAGSEDAVLLSSGYLAGQLVCQTLRESGCELIYAPGTHPALSVEKADTGFSDGHDLESSIERSLELGRATVLLLDSIDFRGGHYPSFVGLRKLPLERLILVVDDSHGFGVTGANGEGSMSALRDLGAKELIVCGSLNKGLAIQAGVVLGTKDRIGQLRESSFFAGASPPSPASVATYVEATLIYREKHQALSKTIGLFASGIQLARNFEYNEGHAAFTFLDPGLVAFLEDQGILVTNFPYPKLSGSLISRLVLSAAHRPGDVERLSAAVNRFNR